MHGGDLLVEHLRACLCELVDRVVNAQLVSRHRLCRDDHRVAALDVHRGMIVVRDPRESGQRLALRPRAEDHLLMRGELLEIRRANEDVVRDVDVSEVPRDVHVLAHRAPDDAHLPPDGDRDVDRLLHPVDVRRERRDENASLAQRNDLAERLADDTLGQRDSRTLRVRRVAEHQVDTLVAQLGEPADVGLESVDRRVVELPVPRVHDASGRRLEDDGHAVGNGVRHPDEGDTERPDVSPRVVRMDLLELRGAHQAVLVQLRLDEPERQPGRPNLGDTHLTEQVRQRADVVLVAVREDHGADVGRTLAEIREVREDEIDAEVLVAREREARVDDHDRAVALDRRHVLPDLAEAAKSHYPAAVRHQSQSKRDALGRR